MARVAILSDIHGNLTALEAVLKDCQSQDVSTYACLGDIVGYGPQPSECITAIQDLNCVCVKGNHDEYCCTPTIPEWFNGDARDALKWTREKISTNQKQWLEALPYTRRLGRNTLVHASPQRPEEWGYVKNTFDAKIVMASQKTPICFYGHTHVPVVYKLKDGQTAKEEGRVITLESTAKYLINVGSVGQPRNGDPRASYVIFDRTERTIEFRKVDYDQLAVIEKINVAGLPEDLGTRLTLAN